MTAETFVTKIVRQPATRDMRVVWSDNFAAVLPYDTVRGYCPCAGCQGHGTDKIRFQEPEGLVTPVTIQPVGNYAISIHWSDGHSTGIYRFEFLRWLAEQRTDKPDEPTGDPQ